MKKERNANIEFLRIISMFFIVIGHFITQNSLQGENPLSNYFEKFLGLGSRMAVNLFLLIGIWFMLNAKVDGKRIMKIYCQTIAYCWPLALVLFCFLEI